MGNLRRGARCLALNNWQIGLCVTARHFSRGESFQLRLKLQLIIFAKWQGLEINAWSVGAGIVTLMMGFWGAIPGILALMRDTPESQRRRGWFGLWTLLFFVVPVTFVTLFMVKWAMVAGFVGWIWFSVRVMFDPPVHRTLHLLNATVLLILVFSAGLFERQTATIESLNRVNERWGAEAAKLIERVSLLEKNAPQ